MRVTVPEKTVEACDFCRREGFLQACHVCGRQFCLACEGTAPNSWGFTTLCCECAGREDVRHVCERYAEQLTPIFEKRNAVLRQLPRKVAEIDATPETE